MHNKQATIETYTSTHTVASYSIFFFKPFRWPNRAQVQQEVEISELCSFEDWGFPSNQKDKYMYMDTYKFVCVCLHACSLCVHFFMAEITGNIEFTTIVFVVCLCVFMNVHYACLSVWAGRSGGGTLWAVKEWQWCCRGDDERRNNIKNWKKLGCTAFHIVVRLNLNRPADDRWVNTWNTHTNNSKTVRPYIFVIVY